MAVVNYSLMKRIFLMALFVMGFAAPLPAADAVSYTHTHFLYTVDYPSDWRVKELSKITSFFSPFESKDDKFSENLNIVVEDLSQVTQDVKLIDYHRKGMSQARKSLVQFTVLEEAKTDFKGREAIMVLYTMRDRGVVFKIRALTFFVDREAYVLTYTATLADYDKYLKKVESILRSIRVSP